MAATPAVDPTDRHRRGWLASPDERKLQNNFDTGAGPVKEETMSKTRVVAQLCAVAMQALALCHADYKHANDWHMRQKLKQGL